MSEHRYSKLTQQNYTTVQPIRSCRTKLATYAAPYTKIYKNLENIIKTTR